MLEIRPRLRRLNDNADLFAERKLLGLRHIAHHNGARRMGKRGLDLGMTRLSNNDNLIALPIKPGSGEMDLLHKGAGGVENIMAEFPRSALLFGRDAVGPKKKRVSRGLLGGSDDGDALGGKVVDDARVVDQGAKGVNRDGRRLGGVLDHAKGALNAVAGPRFGSDLNASGHGYSLSSG